jgi:RNA polymerase sigma-70 factor (ECF subfamily)
LDAHLALAVAMGFGLRRRAASAPVPATAVKAAASNGEGGFRMVLDGQDAGDVDAEDAARVLAGDTDAFAGIVARWQGPLVNLAFRFCRDRSRAEDIAQEAFLKAFRSLATFRGESAFSTWLIALAINVCRSSLRRQAPSLVALDDLAGGAGQVTILLDLERHDEARVLRAAVAGLPARYREALLLYYFAEMNVNDAARLLGVAAGTLKARLHRGRKLLQRRLQRLPRLQPAPPGVCAREVGS